MSNKPNSSSVLGNWLLPIIFLFCLPPVGALMIALKLFSSDGKSRAQVPNSTTRRSGHGKKTAADPDPAAGLASRSSRFSLIGGITAGISLFVLVATLGESARWLFQGEPLWFLEEMAALLPFWCGLGGGLGLWWTGRKLKKKLQHCRQYLAMIGKNSSISISTLAAATGRSPAEVRGDLQDMLDEGYFPAGFLDYGGDRLILSSDGLHEEPEQPASQTRQDTQEQENAVLSEIRAINDAIENPQISAQIDRIGIITTKIFDYQKSNPKKAPELHSFLSYYLPTTLKILRSYAKLESQGVRGENITAAMKRIEEMMDKVVEGFEKQLDQLFQTDTMDLTTDIQVLEQMLKKDGLSAGSGFELKL